MGIPEVTWPPCGALEKTMGRPEGGPVIWGSGSWGVSGYNVYQHPREPVPQSKGPGVKAASL